MLKFLQEHTRRKLISNGTTHGSVAPPLWQFTSPHCFPNFMIFGQHDYCVPSSILTRPFILWLSSISKAKNEAKEAQILDSGENQGELQVLLQMLGENYFYRCFQTSIDSGNIVRLRKWLFWEWLQSLISTAYFFVLHYHAINILTTLHIRV